MPPPLSPYAQKIERHWRKYRPKMCRELASKGQLRPAIEEAESRAVGVEVSALHAGAHPDQAEELAREEWCLPAEEDEEPEQPL